MYISRAFKRPRIPAQQNKASDSPHIICSVIFLNSPLLLVDFKPWSSRSSTDWQAVYQPDIIASGNALFYASRDMTRIPISCRNIFFWRIDHCAWMWRFNLNHHRIWPMSHESSPYMMAHILCQKTVCRPEYKFWLWFITVRWYELDYYFGFNYFFPFPLPPLPPFLDPFFPPPLPPFFF